MIIDQVLLRSILRNHKSYEWTFQGFGMIRTYLDDQKRWRLNVWHPKMRTHGVSDIHDHPWSFTSHVLVGRIKNIVYHHKPTDLIAPSHHRVVIKTGENKQVIEPPTDVGLGVYPDQVILAGGSYFQHRSEIHRTEAEPGTVTLNDRSPATLSYTAQVFYPYGTEWVPATPRKATSSEIYLALDTALERLV